MARAAAVEAKAEFIPVSPGACLSKFQGESERAIRRIFFEARARRDGPTVIFFDEVDALAPTRGGLEDLQVISVNKLTVLVSMLTCLYHTGTAPLSRTLGANHCARTRRGERQG